MTCYTGVVQSFDFEYVLDNWEEEVGVFFAWLNMHCDFSGENELYKKLKQFIKNKKDINDWIQFFEGDPEDGTEVTRRYIESKINRNEGENVVNKNYVY